MTSKRWLYALPGLLCLLGLIGIYSEEKGFLTFFAFAIHFQYLFMPNDEMVEQSMTLSAARAFYCGMVTGQQGPFHRLCLRLVGFGRRPFAVDRLFCIQRDLGA